MPARRVRSGYSDVDRTGQTSEYVSRLDSMRAHPFWVSVKALSIESLQLRPGDRALDVGCGTGDDVQALADVVGPTGRAVGVDFSSTMLDEARTRVAAFGNAIEFRQADAAHLPFGDGFFDGCRAERLLQHLDRPSEAFAEMVRVTRPGGRLALVEPDYGTLSVEGAAADVTRSILDVRCRHFRSGRIGSQLPVLCRRLGLQDMRVQVRVLANSYYGNAEQLRLQKYADAAVAVGAVSTDAAARWLEQLRDSAATGRYRHAVGVFIVSAATP